MKGKTKIIKLTVGEPRYFIQEDEIFVPLTERKLAKHIPGFLDMTQAAREKHFKRWLKEEAEIISRVNVDPQLPNAGRRIKIDGHKRKYREGDLRLGAQAFLIGTEMFQPRASIYRVLSDALCGQHGSALHAAESSFHGTTAIQCASPEVETMLRDMVLAVAPKHEWREGGTWTVKREAVLDYRTQGYLPKHIQDHSRLKLKRKKCRLDLPMPYCDTAVLVIGADSAQLSELSPYIENASAIFLNCGRIEPTPTRLTISGYDPEAAARFRQDAPQIAALMREWWGSMLDDEEAWAREIAQRARASFGRPDSRYLSVTVDPKRMRDAIRYQGLLSFLDHLSAAQLMTEEELEPYRQGAKSVFDPEPEELKENRHVEDPTVFLELMRGLMKERGNFILPEGTRFVKGDKPVAAWRTISGVRHLVLLENTWATEYKRAARGLKGLDCSFFRQEKWTLHMQKRLVQEGLIKAPSSGYRYRYDLLETGEKDTTYVVAIPAHLLENEANP